MYNAENQFIWEIFMESLLEEAFIIKPLNDVDPNQVVGKMEEIEDRNFSYAYSKDAGYLKRDFAFDGFCGVGLFDEHDTINGYLYGYGITDDEYSDLSDILRADPEISIHDDRFAELRDENVLYRRFPELFTKRNTLYVANFAVDKQYRLAVKRLLVDLIRLAKSEGYKYFAFDGLSDTMKLICDEQGNVKRERLAAGGLNLAVSCVTRHGNDVHMFAIIELK